MRTVSIVFFLFGVVPALAQGTAFTYQGRFTESGSPYTGTVEFQVTLWSVPSGGTALATNSPASSIVGVTNGLFILPLDFGPVFQGADYWLQLSVRNVIGPFTTLLPRQRVTPTPYAIAASDLTGVLPASQLSGVVPSANFGGTYSGAVTFDNVASSFTGSGAGLTSLNASELTTGTVPDTRLSGNVSLLGPSIESGEISDGTITNPDLANNAVNSVKIADASVANVDLASDAVTSTKILNGTIVGADLANDSISSLKLTNDAASIGKITGNTIRQVGSDVGISTATPTARLAVR